MKLNLNKDTVNLQVTSIEEWEELMFPHEVEERIELELRSNPAEYGRQLAREVVEPFLEEVDAIFAT